MGLADQLKQPPEDRFSRGQTCGVTFTLALLEPDEAEALRTMIADRLRWPASEIARRCRVENITLTASSIQRHRRGECRCP